ncbi:MAG: bifunctional ADP-dependent NAD(P)H-hydrate dehydratase/NAD(P)H-hydrate epimerase [Hydrogenophilales bacterium 17-61-9]|nr:MAG: bifunctional ADP-dependent NAD(P)H-hydrate dehydratase/NAD(P)H-hydrate epimerase [Hydrogenophilales bacterium 17-61-9]
MPVNPHTLVSPPLFMAADIRAIEQKWLAVHPDAALMEKAGAAVAERAGALANESGAPILFLAGPGNNGGDALVAARLLREQGFRVLVVSRADPGRLPPDAARAWSGWRDSGGTILNEVPRSQAFSLIIDGLFGVGLQRDITGEAARWIAQAQSLECPKLAIDLPSGLDSDSGWIRGCALRADHTLTFLGLKPGLLTADGPDYAGILHLDTLGVDPQTLPATPGIALTQLASHHALPARAQNSHKGLYGHIGIIGGHNGMVGACLIAGRAALQHGAGSVTLGTLDERIVVDYAEPRLMFASPETLLVTPMSVLVIGPGLGQSPRAHALLEAALAAPCPLVLDADALNLLASDPNLAKQTTRRSHPTLLTPHPGEAARLLKLSVAEVQANRIESARLLGQSYRAEIALKGAGTVIAHPNNHYAINTSGGPWLAQAGSGDRLTGMVAALMGQGMGAGNALEAAVWLHGNTA